MSAHATPFCLHLRIKKAEVKLHRICLAHWLWTSTCEGSCSLCMGSWGWVCQLSPVLKQTQCQPHSVPSQACMSECMGREKRDFCLLTPHTFSEAGTATQGQQYIMARQVLLPRDVWLPSWMPGLQSCLSTPFYRCHSTCVFSTWQWEHSAVMRLASTIFSSLKWPSISLAFR